MKKSCLARVLGIIAVIVAATASVSDETAKKMVSAPAWTRSVMISPEGTPPRIWRHENSLLQEENTVCVNVTQVFSMVNWNPAEWWTEPAGADPPSRLGKHGTGGFKTAFRVPGKYRVLANPIHIPGHDWLNPCGIMINVVADELTALSCQGVRTTNTPEIVYVAVGKTIPLNAESLCRFCMGDPQWHTDGSLPIHPRADNKAIADLPISKASDSPEGTPVTVEYHGASRTLHVVVVGVSSVEPDAGTWVDDKDGNPDTQTWVMKKADSGFVTVEAFPEPAIELTTNVAKAIGWRWCGVETNRGSCEVSKTNIGSVTLTCQCGASAKTTTLKIINVKFQTNQVVEGWAFGGGYSAGMNLINTFDKDSLAWTLNVVDGAADAKIDPGKGRVTYGAGGGRYTIRATSKDLPTRYAEMQLCVIGLQNIAGVYEGGTNTVTMIVPPSLSGTNISLRLVTIGGKGSAVFADGSTRTQITDNATVTIKGVLASSIINNINLVAEMNGKELCSTRFTVFKLDLDIDSDNDNGFAMPARDGEEDRIEDIAGDTNHPGKVVGVNHNDDDHDGIPDFADGFNKDGIPGNADDVNTNEHFTPLVLELSETLDLTKTKLKISYEDSNPAGMMCTGAPPVWTPAPGKLRIWKKDGNQARHKNSVMAEKDHGDYVPAGVYDDLDRLGFSNAVRTVTLYVEAIDQSAAVADQRINVTLEPGAGALAGLVGEDTVRLTIVKADLVPDFNHDRVIDQTDREIAKSDVPFRFWINDDHDSGDISCDDSDIPGALPGRRELDGRAPNYADNQVDGRSDLLDFFPLWLDLKQTLDVLPPGQSVQYKLRQDDSAIKVVYTDLTNGQAGAFLTTESSTYGSSFNQLAHQADTMIIINSGVALSEAFLNKIRNEDGKGILLVEGAKATTKPLKLEIWKDGRKIYETEMPFSIAEVENMYRWINLRKVAGGDEHRQTDTSIPTNSPDVLSNGKHFVFAHGYSVDERHARGWHAEMFKRLYQSGSRAMFTAVTWRGNDSQYEKKIFGGVTPNYYTNVIHAFETASALAMAVNGLPGQKYIAGHSLGNMLVSSAIVDHGLNANAYFMLNAAVAMEAYDPNIINRRNMRPAGWQYYRHRLWASEWYQLFPTTDGRNKLTWQNRFKNMSMAYNYYSSTEDVLDNGDGAFHFPLVSHWAWYNQEIRKGTTFMWLALGNSEAGWSFNKDYKGLTVAKANALPKATLRTNSFFRPFGNRELYGPQGSTVAQQPGMHRQLLADAIPALSFAIGRNDLNGFGAGGKNLTSCRRGDYPRDWPRKNNCWRHSDIKNIAYPFNYGVFDEMVQEGGLK